MKIGCWIRPGDLRYRNFLRTDHLRKIHSYSNSYFGVTCASHNSTASLQVADGENGLQLWRATANILISSREELTVDGPQNEGWAKGQIFVAAGTKHVRKCFAKPRNRTVLRKDVIKGKLHIMDDEKKVNQIGKTFRVQRSAQKGIQIIIDGIHLRKNEV